MKKIGYARVAVIDGQNLAEQVEALRDYGCDAIFREQISGLGKSNPELRQALKVLASGDELVVASVSRLSRDHDVVARLVHEIAENGARLVSLDGGFEKLGNLGSTPAQRSAWLSTLANITRQNHIAIISS